MKPEYVFVVGSFRSGTTLVRNILDASEEISICPETQFLGYFISPGFLERIREAGDLSNDANVYRAVDYMYSFRESYWRWLQKNVDRVSFTQSLLETDRSDRALFDLLMRLYAKGKPIVGEKSPGHLYYVPTLLDWFPNARVIHTFRDPRAIFISELRKKRQSRFAGARHRRLQRLGLFVPYILLQVTLTWLRAAYLHKRYQDLYPDRYCLIKFEDLLGHPERHLRLLSDFLDVELSPRILERVISNSSFTGRRGRSGVDMQAVDRWRAHIGPWINRWFLFWGRKQLREFGYI
jgi:hypothetical protein